jgi:serine/threonine protein kinase
VPGSPATPQKTRRSPRPNKAQSTTEQEGKFGPQPFPATEKQKFSAKNLPGVSLREMLTGRQPWGQRGGSSQAVFAAAMSRLIHPAKSLNTLYPGGHFPSELQNVVSQMLATAPHLRPADARAVQQNLQQVAMMLIPQGLHPALISSKMSAQQVAVFAPQKRRQIGRQSSIECPLSSPTQERFGRSLPWPWHQNRI